MGTSFFQMVSNDTQFSVSCDGCDGAIPSSTMVTTPAPTIFTGGDNCGVLAVSAPAAPFLDGCYIDTRYEDPTDEWTDEPPSFTQDGYSTSGQLWISSIYYDTAPNDVRHSSKREFP